MANFRNALLAPAGGVRHPDLRDDLAGSQHGIARQLHVKEILRLDRARRRDDLGIQRDQRRGHVARDAPRCIY